MNRFSFNSVQTHLKHTDSDTEEVTEAVSIRNGKGTKTVRTRKNSKVRVSKKKLTTKEIKNIKTRKFMPNLFTPCHHCLRSTSKKRKTSS